MTAALNLGVAIPSSPGFVGTYQWLGVAALGVFGFAGEAGLAFAIVMQAVWYVPTTLVGAVLLVAPRGWQVGWRRSRLAPIRAAVAPCPLAEGRYSSPSGRWISPSWYAWRTASARFFAPSLR